MSITYEIIKRVDQITTEWAGGTTTQLAIYPPDASYADRAFKWRLSTATVNLPSSRFTSLPGFQRILMILSGEIRLVHENHYEKRLKAFDQDYFNGSWNTTSFGCAVDFNLMMVEGVDGKVIAWNLAPGERREILPTTVHSADGRHRTTAFYAFNGSVEIRWHNEDCFLAEKDALFLHELPYSEQGIALFCPKDSVGCQLIQAEIHYAVPDTRLNIA